MKKQLPKLPDMFSVQDVNVDMNKYVERKQRADNRRQMQALQALQALKEREEEGHIGKELVEALETELKNKTKDIQPLIKSQTIQNSSSQCVGNTHHGLYNFWQTTFKQKKRSFFVSHEDKEYKKIKRLENKRIKKGEKQFKKELKRAKRKNKEWYYEGV